MIRIVDIFKKRTVGFYLQIACMALSLVSCILYLASYVGTSYISWIAFTLFLVAIVVSVATIILGYEKIGIYVSGLINLVAFMFFAYNFYYYISVVVVGIDLTSFDTSFIICTILFALVLALSIAGVFMKQNKSDVTKAEVLQYKA